MPSLLNLPHEIRDAILEIVLLSSRPAPSGVVTAAEHRLEPLSDDQLRYEAWGYGSSHTRFARSDYVSNACPLLLINHQLFAETKSVISRLASACLSYKLDVIFVDDHELWPTWLCIPSLAKQVNHVDVTLRVFDTKGDVSERDAFRGGDGSPPQIYWCFYFLLEHFLTHGPLCPDPYQTSKRTKDREVSVKTLTLNFVAENTHLLPATKDELSRSSFLRAPPRIYLESQSQQDDTEPPRSVIQPEWLAQNITHAFEILVLMDYYTA